MSTAFLISGQMRTFARTFKNQRWMVYRHFADPHFFVTVQDNAQAASIDLLRDAYGADRVHVRLLDDPELPIPSEVSAAWHDAPYANAAPAHQLLLQHWYQNEVWSDFTTYEAKTGADFADIVRIRPDLWFHTFSPKSSFYWKTESQAFVPYWGGFGGVNDRFAILTREAAFPYFTVYPQIAARLAEGCPFHPESLTAAALEAAGCEIYRVLQTEFSTLRMDGSMRPPEILASDLARLAA